MITVQDADRVPVKPIRGQLIQLQTDPGVIHRVIWGPDGYLVPWPDGSVLVGSTVEDVGFDEASHRRGRRKVEGGGGRRSCRAWRMREMSSVRTGLRPKGPDDLPILGRSKAVPGLIYATAHYRNGVHVRAADGAAGRAISSSIAPAIRHCAISIRPVLGKL